MELSNYLFPNKLVGKDDTATANNVFADIVNNARKVILMMKDHLLKGCCSNECTYVEDFFGKNGILGMAYHS